MLSLVVFDPSLAKKIVGRRRRRQKSITTFAKKILMGSKVNELELMSVRGERAKLASLEALKKQPRHDRFFFIR